MRIRQSEIMSAAGVFYALVVYLWRCASWLRCWSG